MDRTIETPDPYNCDIARCDGSQRVVDVLRAIQSRQPVRIGSDKRKLARKSFQCLKLHE